MIIGTGFSGNQVEIIPLFLSIWTPTRLEVNPKNGVVNYKGRLKFEDMVLLESIKDIGHGQ